MRIAFYAPMKPPTATQPSGDRRMARALMAALRRAGHEVGLASRFRSRDGAGDPERQHRLRARGERIAERLIARYRSGAAPAPELWFTYHLYYKAPDWIGPAVSRALGVPYVVAEASHAPKRAGGGWAIGHDGAEAAIRAADRIVCINSADAPCLLPLVGRDARLEFVRPFIDAAPFARAARDRAAAAMPSEIPLLIAVAMMRQGDKLASYALLAAALRRIAGRPWRLAVVGDGPARPAVEAAMAPLGPGRVRFLGERPAKAMPGLLADADLFVWPAIREAYGMALLEAQAAGLPVVAGDTGGVPDIVRHGETGLLAPVGDEAAFADAVAALLSDPARRRRMGNAAARNAAADHSLDAAARELDRIVTTVGRRRAA